MKYILPITYLFIATISAVFAIECEFPMERDAWATSSIMALSALLLSIKINKIKD